MSNKSIIPVRFFERPAIQVARDLIGSKAGPPHGNAAQFGHHH
jgi:hypothetical protein